MTGCGSCKIASLSYDVSGRLSECRAGGEQLFRSSSSFLPRQLPPPLRCVRISDAPLQKLPDENVYRRRKYRDNSGFFVTMRYDTMNYIYERLKADQ